MGKPLPISLHVQELALLEKGVHISRVNEFKSLSESAIYSTQRQAQH
jgi:hypothetical protein